MTPSHGHIENQQGVVTGRIERVFGGFHLAAKQPAEAPGIQIAPLERLLAEMLPQRLYEARIGTAVCGFTIAIAFPRG